MINSFSEENLAIGDNRVKIGKPCVTDDKTAVHVQQLVDVDLCVSIFFIAETLNFTSGGVFNILKHKPGQKKANSAIFALFFDF